MQRWLVLVLAGLMALVPVAAAKEAKKAATISALQAAEMLDQEGKPAFLIDVRTRAEYALAGHAPQAYNVPWRFGTVSFQVKDGPYQSGPAPDSGYQLSREPNPDFAGVVQSLFKPEDRLIVISTMGDQGAEAADALVAAGFQNVSNVRHGYWGQPLTAPDEDKLAEKYSPHHGLRGKLNGWIFWGLPLTHRVDPRHVYPPDLKRMQNTK
jgi:rhodanese-related sulfurtransferase